MKHRKQAILKLIIGLIILCPTSSFAQENTDSSQQNMVTKQVSSQTIKRGFIKMQVEDYQAFRIELDEVVDQLKGFVATENEVRTQTSLTNTIAIRIPNDQFSDLVNALTKKAVKINSREMKVINVNSEKQDIDKRIATKHDIKQRYLQLLKKTKLESEITRINEQLETVNKEIEKLQAQLTNLQETNYSTLNLEAYQFLAVSMQTTDKDNSFAGQMLQNITRNPLPYLIGFAVIIAIIMGSIVYMYRLHLKNKRKKRRSSKNKGITQSSDPW